VDYLGSGWSGIRRGFSLFAFLTLIAFGLHANAQHAQLVTHPSNFDFGSVPVGTSVTKSLVLENYGGPKLTITGATLSGTGFTLSGLNYPVTLAAGQGVTCTVTFAPISGGADSGNVSIAYMTKWLRNGQTTDNSATVPLSGTGVSSGQLTPSPASLNFGNVQTGNLQTLSETVTNTVGASVTISAASASGSPFSETGPALPLTLAVGQTATFSVTFSPSAGGASSGNLTITSNASDPTVNVSLSGTGVTPGTVSSNPTSQAFGTVATGSSSTLGQTLTNTGGSTLTVSQITASGAGFSYSGITPPVVLTAGQSVNFSVVFAPQSGGNASGNLVVNSNASDPTLTVPLTGTGNAPGQLAVSPASLSFGNVVDGTSQSQSGTLTASNGPVTVTGATSSEAEFTVTGVSFPVTIPAGYSTNFSVTFAPTTSGAASANITFASNASNSSPVQAASGSGTPPPQHSAALSWNASTSSTVVGYSIYRGTVSGGPYTQINSALDTTTSDTDNTVAAGQTYYYVVTAVDSAGTESPYSNQTTAVIPTP
jgi:hypothetical protein